MPQTMEVPRVSRHETTTGTYTQVPNVFLDTCDLPETAQLLYLRLSRHLWQEGHVFRGSVRKLSSLVHLSKSTVDRMAKRLKESGLIDIAYEEGQETSRAVMVVTLSKAALWDLNKHYHENPCAVPIWDTKLPHCPNAGQHDTTLGQDDLNLGQQNTSLGQIVPGSCSKVDPKQKKTFHTSSTQRRQSESAPSALQLAEVESGLSPTLLSLLSIVSEEELTLALTTIMTQREYPVAPLTMQAQEPAQQTHPHVSVPSDELVCLEEKQSKMVPLATMPAEATKPAEPAQQRPAHHPTSGSPMALPAAQTDPPLPPQKQSSGEGQKRRRAVSTEVALTLQGARVLDLYDSLKGRKTTRSAEALRAANGLGEVMRSDEDFVAVLEAIANDSFLKQKQVRIDLDFVYRKYDGFLDRVERAREKAQQGCVQTDYNKVATMTDGERAAYKREQQEKLKHAQPPGIDREALMKLTPEERIAVLKEWRKPPLSA